MNTITYWSIGIALFTMGFNAAMFIVIKFNDMKHLAKDVEEIKTDVKTLIAHSQKLDVRMTRQEEHCKMMHKRGSRSKNIE